MNQHIIGIMPYSDEILSRIEQFEASIREDYGQNITVTVALVEKKYQIDAIAKLVSETLGVTMDDLMYSRDEEQVLARHLAMYLCKKHIKKANLTDIAKYFNKRHHTTAINSCKVVADLLESKNELLMAYYEKCQNEIKKLITNENNLRKTKQ